MADARARILVVDDDATLRELLVDTLSSLEYEVAAATDGVEALEVLTDEHSEPYDLVITDIKMPRMDGVNLTKRLRRYFPGLPVLTITAYPNDKIISEAAPNGSIDKPFRISHLEDAVERALSGMTSHEFTLPEHRVLICITDSKLREQISTVMSRHNLLPFAVGTCVEASEELERGSFDLIITSAEQCDSARMKNMLDISEDYPHIAKLLLWNGTKVNAVPESAVVDHFQKVLLPPYDAPKLLDAVTELCTPSPPPSPGQ